MREIPAKYLITAFTTELILFVSALVLIGISPYFWIMTCITGVLLSVTSYLIAIKGIGCAVKLKTEYGISQQRNYEWMQSFKTEFEISLREYSKETQNRLEELSDVQNRLMQDNNLLCNRMDRSIEAMCSNNSESLIKINSQEHK